MERKREFIKNNRILKSLMKGFPSDRVFAFKDVPFSALGYCALGLSTKRCVIVVATPIDAERCFSDLLSIPDLTPFHIPLLDDSATVLMEDRINAVDRILSDSAESVCVVLSITALLQKVSRPDLLQAASLKLQLNSAVDFDELKARLVAMGYERHDGVVEPSGFAVRGGIIDIWQPGAMRPIRLDFFGDELDSIRIFDPATQCSVEKISEVVIPPVNCSDIATVSLLSLLRKLPFLIVNPLAVNSVLEQNSQSEKFNKNLVEKAERVCFVGESFIDGVPVFESGFESVASVRELGGSRAKHPEFYAEIRKGFFASLELKAQSGENVCICLDSEASKVLILSELPQGTKIKLFVLPISEGFTFKPAKTTVVAQSDLYPAKRAWQAPVSKKSLLEGPRIENSLDVVPGELIVHLEYGIGKFLGFSEMMIDGKKTEVLSIEYADGAKLHIPPIHAHLLSRYIGPDPKHVKLHSLDGNRWRRERTNAQSSVEDLAAGLLETQARRRITPGFAFDVNATWIREFEAMFPYQETVDQERVIAEVKADMAKPLAMDRLICGDAGYGKTEIALRAAFIAVMNHKQVAILAPTTVLAEQHYETFCDRMSSFPVVIDVLSRFRTVGQRQLTKKTTAEGKVDILIGTHALLSADLPFKDLGLLIIDEEQRFGVVHKERIKSIRSLVDILTLSATPIPRTLYMSMTGARDMSLLQTPPQNRVAVETFVQKDTDAIVKKAIEKELNRGGQVFYLYNRVLTIHRVYERLHSLLPQAKIGVIHSKLATAELSLVMQEFENGKLDILISTTIIESGIDIPRANTILIDRADRFGISDLYQLRGRVGRSAVKGYAYLLLPEVGRIESDARQRIEALKRYSGLSAGYNLALRDLEIRGSGNLLGSAQSGHIAAIGFGLYCQLLRRTIAGMKGEKVSPLVTAVLSLDFVSVSPGDLGNNVAALPYDYIEDDSQRMGIFMRISEAADKKDLAAIKKEMIDRFGPIPKSVTRFLTLTELRIIASAKKIAKIEVKNNRLTFFDSQNHAPFATVKNIEIPETKLDKKIAFIGKMLADA